VRLFDHLPTTYRERLVNLATEIHVPAGHTLIRRGERSDDMYRVLQGRLEVVDVRNQVVLDVMGPGQVVGEMAFVTEEARSADVRSGEDSRVLVWRGADLHRAMDDDPVFGTAMFRAFSNLLAERLRNTTGYAVTRTNTDSVAFASVSDDVGRSARALSDELKASLFLAEERLKIEPEGPAVEAVSGSLSTFLNNGHRLFAGLGHEEAEGAGELLHREIHPFLSAAESSTLIRSCGEGGLGLSLVLAHLQSGNAAGSSEVGRALDTAILEGETAQALCQREAALFDASVAAIPAGRPTRMLVTPSHHGALIARIAYKLGYEGGEIVYMDRDPDALRATDNGMAMRPKKLKYTPVRGDLLDYFGENRTALGQFGLVVLHGLLDYLPMRLLPDLAECIESLLEPGGQALLVQLSPSTDDFFFDHLLGWRTIRRGPDSVVRLLESAASLKVEVVWEGNAASLLRVHRTEAVRNPYIGALRQP
jgi:CRP-like cAMP-binding protein